MVIRTDIIVSAGHRGSVALTGLAEAVLQARVIQLAWLSIERGGIVGTTLTSGTLILGARIAVITINSVIGQVVAVVILTIAYFLSGLWRVACSQAASRADTPAGAMAKLVACGTPGLQLL